MAYVQSHCGQTNNENIGQNEFKSLKNMKAMENNPNKKSVLTEVKNVLHNQIFATPIKRLEKSHFGANLLQNVPFKQMGKKQEFVIPQQKDKTSFLKSLSPFRRKSPCKEFDDLDYFDMHKECWAKPLKSNAAIWSEMNLFDDSHLNDVIQRGTWYDAYNDDDRSLDINVDEVLSEDAEDISSDFPYMSNMLNTALCDSVNECDDDFIPLPPPTLMEDFDLRAYIC